MIATMKTHTLAILLGLSLWMGSDLVSADNHDVRTEKPPFAREIH